MADGDISSSCDYYRARERTERDAAARAHCLSARQAHQQMADLYAELASSPDAPPPRDEDIIGMPPIMMPGRDQG